MVGTLMVWLQDTESENQRGRGGSKMQGLGQVLPWWAGEGQGSVEVKEKQTIMSTSPAS